MTEQLEKLFLKIYKKGLSAEQQRAEYMREGAKLNIPGCSSCKLSNTYRNFLLNINNNQMVKKEKVVKEKKVVKKSVKKDTMESKKPVNFPGSLRFLYIPGSNNKK